VNERLRRAAAAFVNASAGGFLATPPSLDGSVGLGIAGVTGAAAPPRWDDDAVWAVGALAIHVVELPG
jgi:hypothetical protein